MSIDDDKLIAFIDGELSLVEQAEIEAALAQDESLREKIAAHKRLRTRISAAFDGALAEPLPKALRDAALAKPHQAEIVNFATRRAARWSAREWGAMAASVAAGLLIGVGVMRSQPPMLSATDDGLLARGALARALDIQLASDNAEAVRIGLSFRARDGRYCRTFELTRATTAGLACREDNAWQVALTTMVPASGNMRMAAASAEIVTAVEEMIEGEPLDAPGEAQARDAGWQ